MSSDSRLTKGSSPRLEILHCAQKLLDPRHLARLRATPSPYGDGLASERIAVLAAHAAGAELVRTGGLLDALAAS